MYRGSITSEIATTVGYYLVDDGSDHDHDSHIMVWQVREDQVESTGKLEVDSRSSRASSSSVATDHHHTKLEVESRSSRGSSSVDLGPAPGSGLITADASEASDTENTPTIQRQAAPLSMGVEMTESMTASSLLRFNRDVESMMENEPREDFTQQIQ